MKTIWNLLIAAGVSIVAVSPTPSLAESLRSQVSNLLKKRNLLAIPSLSSQVKNSSSKSSAASTRATPPTLSSIPGNSIKNLFWGEIQGINIIDGILSATPPPAPFCGAFYSGMRDGESGGLGACHMAESVGYSYSEMLRGGTSFCYMKNFPTKKNLRAGAIEIISGELPTGGIEKLFSAPTGDTSRLVKVRVLSPNSTNGEGEDSDRPEILFLQVASQSENRSAGNLYKVDLWFCSQAGDVRGYDTITISKALRFTNMHAGRNEVQINSTPVTIDNISTSEGYLSLKGNSLIWNPAKSRMASTRSEQSTGGQFMSEVEITPSSLIKVKRMDSFGDTIGKGYAVTQYSGSSAQDLRFLSGAFKDLHKDNTFTQAIEYRNTFYAIDGSSALKDDVEDVDFSDAFYSSELGVELHLTDYSCATTPDIEVTMDSANPTLDASLRECAADLLEGMHFCHDDPEVSQADQKVQNTCSFPGP